MAGVGAGRFLGFSGFSSEDLVWMGGGLGLRPLKPEGLELRPADSLPLRPEGREGGGGMRSGGCLGAPVSSNKPASACSQRMLDDDGT